MFSVSSILAYLSSNKRQTTAFVFSLTQQNPVFFLIWTNTPQTQISLTTTKPTTSPTPAQTAPLILTPPGRKVRRFGLGLAARIHWIVALIVAGLIVGLIVAVVILVVGRPECRLLHRLWKGRGQAKEDYQIYHLNRQIIITKLTRAQTRSQNLTKNSLPPHLPKTPT